MARWCDRCKRDAAYLAGTGDSCPIVAKAFIYPATDPKYPAEWRHGENGPECTAFEAAP